MRSRFARALLAFLALPGVVAFAAPLLLLWPVTGRPMRLVGVVPFALGVALLLWCVREFYHAGKGTLAPWDPPRELVTSGPYRRSRNPMYVAVTLILAGWAMVFHSGTLLVYAAVVATAFHLRVTFGEEPWLARTHRERWTRYAARTPRWAFATRRALLAAWAVAIALVPLAGLVYAAYKDGVLARDFPPPGVMVDMGGYRLHLVCTGEGAPTVIFESSGHGNAMSNAAARASISQRTRVCSYDRQGLGWSDGPASSLTPASLARDLAVLQDRAKLRGPYVIVASSIGGLTAERFALDYPERVAGLVFLDAASSEMTPHAARWMTSGTTAACGLAFAARFGVMHLVDPFGIGATDSDEARRSAAVTYRSGSWDTLCATLRGIGGDPHGTDVLGRFPNDIPVRVLSATAITRSQRLAFGDQGRELANGWHQRLALRSARGAWRVVPNSQHLIASEQPDVVVDEVFALLDELR